MESCEYFPFFFRQVKKMLKRILAAGLLCLLLFAGACAAEVKAPPAPRGAEIYVQDYAGVLPQEARAQIMRIGAQLEARTKAQLVVVTVQSLEGAPVDEYALAILRGWGVGDKALNNGVVVLVSVGDRQSRVEVGYGLEGALPDARTGQIQDEYMLPHFREGRYAQGILDGYTALARRIADEYKVSLGGLPPFQKAAGASAAGQESGLLGSLQDFIVAGIFLALVLLDFLFFGGRFTLLLLALFRSRGGGGGGGFGGGSGGGGGSSRRW